MTSPIELAIVELDSLMSKDDSSEADFQNWYEVHPIVFEAFGYLRNLPHPTLPFDDGKRYVPDFMCERIDTLWDIVELKLPSTAVLQNRERRETFYKEFIDYIAQVHEYSEYFANRANLAAVEARYGIQVQNEPDPIIIAGRSSGLDRQKVHRLTARTNPRVRLMTYDDVKAHLEFVRIKIQGAIFDGYTIHLVLAIHESASRQSILDIGSTPWKNRLTVTIDEEGDLQIVSFDSLGRKVKGHIPRCTETFQYDSPFALSVEVGGNEKTSILRTEINGKFCSEVKFNQNRCNFDSFDSVVCGSDYFGRLESNFTLAQLIIFQRVFDFREKSSFWSRIQSDFADALYDGKPFSSAVRFEGGRFLRTSGHPNIGFPKEQRKMNLIQPILLKQPEIMVDGKRIGAFVTVFYDQSGSSEKPD